MVTPLECHKLQYQKQRASTRQDVAVAPSSFESTLETPFHSHALTIADVEVLIHQVLSRSFTALFATLGKSSWFIDSTCCNHMTFDPTLFSYKTAIFPNPGIRAANGSHMSVTHIGSVSSSSSYVNDT